MSEGSLSITEALGETIVSNVSAQVPIELLTMTFPSEANSFESLVNRFDNHLGVIRGKHQFLIGKNCLDSYSIDLKVIDSFPEIAFNLHFNQYLLNQLHDAITRHPEFKPVENRGYYLRAMQEAEAISSACFLLMKKIKSWVHEGP